jgi:hypothetical protein
MAFTALNPFASIVTNLSTVRIGFNSLAIQNGCRRSGTFIGGCTNKAAEPGVKSFPGIIFSPLPENMENSLEGRKVRGQETPLNASLDHIEDRINDASAVRRRSTAFLSRWQHRFEHSPLIIGETRVVKSDFHRLKRSCAFNWKASFDSLKSSYFCVFLFRFPENLILKPPVSYFSNRLLHSAQPHKVQVCLGSLRTGI